MPEYYVRTSTLLLQLLLSLFRTVLGPLCFNHPKLSKVLTRLWSGTNAHESDSRCSCRLSQECRGVKELFKTWRQREGYVLDVVVLEWSISLQHEYLSGDRRRIAHDRFRRAQFPTHPRPLLDASLCPAFDLDLVPAAQKLQCVAN